jgi:CTP:molybdopterin cytidylyltransferase MocA
MADPTIILLAAGAGARMRGRDKMLEPVNGRPLIAVMARRALRAGVPVRVVIDAGQTARRDALGDLPAEIVSPAGKDGMAASIRAGVAGLRGPVLLALADMPEITAHDFHLLLSLAAKSPECILRAAARNGTPGHPVVFPADLLPDLARLKGDKGARDLLRSQAGRLRLLPLADDRAITDLDTPEAWDAWRARHTAGGGQPG